MASLEQRLARLEQRLETRIASLEQRMARLEGLLDGLREGLFERVRSPELGPGVDPRTRVRIGIAGYVKEHTWPNLHCRLPEGSWSPDCRGRILHPC